MGGASDRGSGHRGDRKRRNGKKLTQQAISMERTILRAIDSTEEHEPSHSDNTRSVEDYSTRKSRTRKEVN